jgi:hypothetical protein
MSAAMWIVFGILSMREYISRKDKDFLPEAALREYETFRLTIIRWIKQNYNKVFNFNSIK